MKKIILNNYQGLFYKNYSLHNLALLLYINLNHHKKIDLLFFAQLEPIEHQIHNLI